MASESIRRRLALLEGLALSQADIESISAEFEHFDRALQDLENFIDDMDWPSLPMQPYAHEVKRGGD